MKKRFFVIIASFIIFTVIIMFLIIKFGKGLEISNKPMVYTTI